MKFIKIQFLPAFMVLTMATFLFAQVSSAQSSTQKNMLSSKNPKFVKNKKVVYDFWREVLEAGHMELADKYMTETYIQHNPNVPTGRQGFIDFISKLREPQPIIDSIKAPLISIVAEGDLVVLVFNRELPDPKDPSKKYTTTSFDMFRIEGGKVAEHWDAALKQ
jgi:predicted SnoaL-like aldol condensation-catalyzing enzyme